MIKPKHLSYKRIQSIAEKFLEKHKPNSPIPIPIDEIVEIDLGIVILTIPGLKKYFEIDGFISSDFSTITLDDNCYNHYESRTRFTIAHELGHKILHEDIYKAHKFSTIEEYKEFQDKIPENNHQWLEFQANVFAACLLVPKSHLKTQVDLAVEENLGGNLQADLSIPFLIDLPVKFNVSDEVIYRRIQKDGILREKL